MSFYVPQYGTQYYQSHKAKEDGVMDLPSFDDYVVASYSKNCGRILDEASEVAMKQLSVVPSTDGITEATTYSRFFTAEFVKLMLADYHAWLRERLSLQK